MKRLCLVLVVMLISACASHPPLRSDTFSVTDTLKVPYDKAWQKTLQVLQEEGFSIDASSEKGGVISVAESVVRLNERQADCGSFHGMSYLKDYRTSTFITLVIDLEKASNNVTTIRVNSTLKAAFNAGIGSETKYLACYSRGSLEKHLISQIRD